MTTVRLKIYAADLADLSPEQLSLAFNRARRECKFFPKIAELRALSGCVTPEKGLEVEAAAAFQSVIRSLERKGVDYGTAHLPERTQFAVRQCGGLRHFNQRLDSHTYAFLQKDFVAAYESFSAYTTMAPGLTEKGILALPPQVRLFLESKEPSQTVPRPIAEIKSKPKAFPQPLSESQAKDRREMLRKQIERVQELRGGSEREPR
jgi:hypothetical protein